MKKIFTLLALTISFSINAQTDNTSTGTSALNSTDGFNHGLVKTFYDNGNLKETSFYSNGKLNGTLQSYFENGKLQASRFLQHQSV